MVERQRTSNPEKNLVAALSIKETTKHLELVLPYLVHISAIGSVATICPNFFVDARNRLYSLANDGKVPISPSVEVHDSTSLYIAELVEPRRLTPNSLSFDFIVDNSPAITRVATKDRERPLSAGVEVSAYMGNIDVDFDIFSQKRWRFEIAKTEGNTIKKIKLVCFRPTTGDYFLTFTHDLVPQDRLGKRLAALRESLINSGVYNPQIDSEEMDLILINLQRFYMSVGLNYLPPDYKRDRFLLKTSASADEFLKEFLENVKKAYPDNLTRPIQELLSNTIENVSSRPTRTASVTTSVRFNKRREEVVQGELVAAGVSDDTAKKFDKSIKDSIVANQDRLAALYFIAKGFCEDNSQCFRDLLLANIEFEVKD